MIKAKFSPKTGGIYPIDVYKNFPADAMDIPQYLYDKYLKGEIIGFTANTGELEGSEPLPPTYNENILELEASITSRRVREAILGIDNGWLRDTDIKIQKLRGQL